MNTTIITSEKLNRLDTLEKRGKTQSLTEDEIRELSLLYIEMFGHNISEAYKSTLR